MKNKKTLRQIALIAVTVILFTSCSLIFASCGRTSNPEDEMGLSFYLNDTKDGYYVKSYFDRTEYVIPDEYKGKPVIGIVEEGFFTGSKNISGKNYNRTKYTKITVPDTLTYVGPNAFQYIEGCKYNEYEGAYYLGNDKNPYVVLVHAFGENVIVADTCKIICDYAISSKVETLKISASVGYISFSAFGSAAPRVILKEGNEVADQPTGLETVSVDESNPNYKSVNNKMVLNKSGTRLLCAVADFGLVIPSTVEFVEPAALIGGYSNFAEYSEEGSEYLPSENNPHFILLYSSNGEIANDVKIIAQNACQSGKYVVPDSVVQVMPYAFNGKNVTVTVTSGGWFRANQYLDGMAYDFVVSAESNKEKSTVLYLKEGDLDKVIVDNPNLLSWNHHQFRRYK